MIEEISPVNLVHITMTKEYAKNIGTFWVHWRTTQNGDYWENLVGMSWEEMYPPQEFIDEYKRLMNIL